MLQREEIIPFSNFKEKMEITKKYERLAKMEILDNRYVYLKYREKGGSHGEEYSK